jgi:hypothetical protein
MTTPHHGQPDGAPHVDTAVLMDYWLAALSPEDEEVVDLHLLSCDACGGRLRDVIDLAERLHVLVRSGSLQVIVDEAVLTRARANGLRVREYAPPRGQGIDCTVTLEDDLLIARLAANLSTASRVDVSWCDLEGVERQRMVDIPVRAGVADVICQQSITWGKASPTISMVARLLAVGEDGGESVLGEYTFHHTRTIPGPPGW